VSAWARLVKVIWKGVAPAAGLGARALALFFLFHSPRERSYRLRMTAGNRLGMRHRWTSRARRTPAVLGRRAAEAGRRPIRHEGDDEASTRPMRPGAERSEAVFRSENP
jgi:hypothetical protein